MSVPVPQTDQAASVARMLTGLPVSGSNHMRWNSDLLFHNCYVAHPIVAAAGLPAIISSPTVYYVGFKKSPGVNVLKVSIEPNVSAAGTRPQIEVAVTSSAGSVAWIETGSALYLDGTNRVTCDSSNFQDNTIYTNHLDVSALTNGTFYDLIFTCTDKSGGATRSLYSINVTEVPLADVDPVGSPSTELGADASWLMSNNANRIVDGSTSISYGVTRVLDQLEVARYQRRQHWQLIRCEDTSNAWSATTTVAGTAFPFSGTSTFRLRARPLHGTSGVSAVATFSVRIRYRTSTTNKPTFRFAVTPVGGATTNTDHKLAASSGAWTATTVDNSSTTMTLSLPCTGTDSECDLTLGLWNDIAGTVYVSQILLCANES